MQAQCSPSGFAVAYLRGGAVLEDLAVYGQAFGSILRGDQVGAVVEPLDRAVVIVADQVWQSCDAAEPETQPPVRW